MADLMQLLQSQVTDSLMDQLAGQLGGAPKEKTSSAVSGAMSLLMGALAKNASTPEGASSLMGALDRDHDGSILDDVAGFLGGSKQASNANMLNGAGILKHLLGGKQENAASMLSKDTGMDTGQIMNLMIKVAPMVLDAKSGTVQVTCVIDNSDNRYRSGMRCVVRLPGGARPSTESSSSTPRYPH